MPEVYFVVNCDTKPGDSVRVVGNCPLLGFWDPCKSSVELTTDERSYPWWTGKCEVEAGSNIEFKLCVVSCEDTRWEANVGNRSLCVPDSAATVNVQFDEASDAADTSNWSFPIAWFRGLFRKADIGISRVKARTVGFAADAFVIEFHEKKRMLCWPFLVSHNGCTIVLEYQEPVKFKKPGVGLVGIASATDAVCIQQCCNGLLGALLCCFSFSTCLGKCLYYNIVGGSPEKVRLADESRALSSASPEEAILKAKALELEVAGGSESTDGSALQLQQESAS